MIILFLVQASCETGWAQNETSCYKVYSSLNYQYPEANDTCITQGGHLASIDSESEDIFIRNHIK